MSNIARCLAACLLLLALHCSSHVSAQYYVSSTTGNDGNSCTTSAAPCLTINQAVTLARAANSATTTPIYLDAGNYTGSSNVNLVLSVTSVNITCLYGASTCAIVQSDSSSTPFLLHNYSSTATATALVAAPVTSYVTGLTFYNVPIIAALGTGNKQMPHQVVFSQCNVYATVALSTTLFSLTNVNLMPTSGPSTVAPISYQQGVVNGGNVLKGTVVTATNSLVQFTDTVFVNLTVGGFTLSGTGATYLTRWSVTNCTISTNNAGSSMINVAGTHSLYMSQCHIYQLYTLTRIVYVGTTATLVIADTTFENLTTSTGKNYAVDLEAVGTLVQISNTVFSSCNFTTNNVLYAAGASINMTVSNTTWQNNVIGEGNVRTFGASQYVVFYNNTFIGNQASTAGGGLSLHPTSSSAVGVFIIDSCTFTNNTSSGSSGGGALFVQTVANITISNTYFYGNNAPVSNGGAITSSSVQLMTIVNSTFVGNYASNGGCFYMSTHLYGPSMITFAQNTFINNSAYQAGVLV